ncbi:MAG: sugar-binding protein [Kiritimatiellae bacterium]|nr:sugar-binding protein [Kiritimatiellia bacterium]
MQKQAFPLCVWVLALGLGHAAVGHAATELLKNGSFADPVVSNALPHWSVNTWQSRATATAVTDPQTGAFVRLSNPSSDDRCALTQSLRNLSFRKGTLLRLSGRYRTDDFARGDGPQFFVSVQFAFKVTTGATPSLHVTLQSADAWTPFEQRIGLDRAYEVDELVATIAFIRCRGTLSLSQLSLQVIEPAEDLTLFSLKKTPPLVDGDLGDPCWQGAQTAAGFMALGKVAPAAADTEVRSCYDDANLYLAIKLNEPHTDRLQVSPRGVFAGDCVEVFLDPRNEGRSYFHFAVDSHGNHYAGFNDGTEQTLSLEIAARSARGNGFWAVEMAIPFAALEAPLPRDNQRWLINVGRERYAVTPGENSSWAALGAFSQRERFGRLAFYSRHEIVADINYWNQSDRDPLMMRPSVSGYLIAQANAGARRTPTLWTYDPFGADRTNKAWKGRTYPGIHQSRPLGEKEYPEFYRAAQGINRCLIAKARADERLTQLRRQAYYAVTRDAEDTTGVPATLEQESGAIDEEMNAIYMAYGSACDVGWSKDRLEGIDRRIADLTATIDAFHRKTDETAATLGTKLQAQSPWKRADLTLAPDDRRLNADGATRRFSFSAWSSIHSGTEEPYSLLTAFDAGALHWPAVIPRPPESGKYDYLDQTIGEHGSFGFPKALTPVAFGIHSYLMPLTQVLAEKAKTDPDIVLRSQDGLTGTIASAFGIPNFCNGGNPNHAEVKAYVDDYLRKLAAYVAPGGRMDFFLTAWESSVYFYGAGTNGTSSMRSTGFNVSGKAAFREYLRERYANIRKLNRKWRASYPSFDAIEPPDDKYIRPAVKPSGLVFEFERWQRVNWVRYIAGLRASLKSGAPDIPVQVDPSVALLEMNGYLLFKEQGADIYAYHDNPGSEEAMWNYLSTMNRKFGKVLGHQENYFQMYAAAHLNDERLAQRDIRKWFFDMLMHDIRYSTWWLSSYMSHKTDYIVAYGGGTFGVDYDQTILRWSIAGLAPLFDRCRSIERALIESSQYVPKTAIIQPCTTVFMLSAMGQTCQQSTAIREMLRTHYQLLLPGNHPHDYLPEEMVLDGKAELADYSCLVLPYAPYMTEKFSRLIMKWVKRGGNLIAFGPFAVADETGRDLTADVSLFRALFPNVQVTGPNDWGTLRDGTPWAKAMEVRSHGKGSVVCLNRSADVIMRDASLAKSLQEHLAVVAERTAVSPAPDLKILTRTGRRGEMYLCLLNNNVEAPLETTVTVSGAYRQALDILVPGWCPVPAAAKDDQTCLNVRLDPGDFTLILLRP